MESVDHDNLSGDSTLVRAATWNMDHWQRSPEQRERGWALLKEQGIDIALLQETVPPRDLPRSQIVYREIGGGRPWGSAVVALKDGWKVEEVQTVRTRYGSHRFPMIGVYPGAVIVAKVDVPAVGPLTFVSLYGMMTEASYAQTTMLRIAADLIPLFDSPEGRHVVLGGDFNVTTACAPTSPELERYRAILQVVGSLGLKDLADVAPARPPRPDDCPCGDPACRHLATYRGKEEGRPPTQLDYLFATGVLATRCERLSLLAEPAHGLSDHVPIVAELRIPTLDRSWSLDDFLAEVGRRNDTRAQRVVEELMAWAERRHGEAQRGPVRGVDLRRLPISDGPEPEMWFQLDVGREQAVQWTCSVRARGDIVMQLQRLRPPFDTDARREEVWGAVNDIVGGLEKRISGRPTFPLSRLEDAAKRQAFLSVLGRIIDRTLDRLAMQGAG